VETYFVLVVPRTAIDNELLLAEEDSSVLLEDKVIRGGEEVG